MMKHIYLPPVTETETFLMHTFLCASPNGETPIGGIGEPAGSEFIPM